MPSPLCLGGSPALSGSSRLGTSKAGGWGWGCRGEGCACASGCRLETTDLQCLRHWPSAGDSHSIGACVGGVLRLLTL